MKIYVSMSPVYGCLSKSECQLITETAPGLCFRDDGTQRLSSHPKHMHGNRWFLFELLYISLSPPPLFFFLGSFRLAKSAKATGIQAQKLHHYLESKAHSPWTLQPMASTSTLSYWSYQRKVSSAPHSRGMNVASSEGHDHPEV